ncbi:MAG: iron-sulfur cluster assembly protein [Chloroflexota bacterium]|nr:iron-sulfur cluster assembly protein [Chloroflexota bacterium]
MLQITHGAATFLSELREGQDVPETYGLRIYHETTEADEVTVALGFTDSPTDGDQVTEQDGLRVFVAPELAAPLADAAMDVSADEEAPRLLFRPQRELQD